MSGMKLKTKYMPPLSSKKWHFIIVLIVLIPILIIFTNVMSTVIDRNAMQRANEASFRDARELAAEIDKIAVGLTREEVREAVIDILGSNQFSFPPICVPGSARAPWYHFQYHIGTYYEWNSQGQNFVQPIHIVMEMDEVDGTVISTFLIKMVVSDFVLMD